MKLKIQTKTKSHNFSWNLCNFAAILAAIFLPMEYLKILGLFPCQPDVLCGCKILRLKCSKKVQRTIVVEAEFYRMWDSVVYKVSWKSISSWHSSSWRPLSNTTGPGCFANHHGGVWLYFVLPFYWTATNDLGNAKIPLQH